jgi:hypothetical protein
MMLPLLLGLCAAFPIDLRGTPLSVRGAAVEIGNGPLLSIEPVVRARYGGQEIAVRGSEWRVRRRGTSFSLEATAHHRLVDAEIALRGTEGVGRVRLIVRLTYRRAAVVEAERIELLAAPERARALGRDLRWHSVAGTSRLDASTPKVLEMEGGGSRVQLLGEDDFPSATLRSDGHGRLRIGLEIDHAGNHPFRTYPCTRLHRPRGAGIGQSLRVGERAPRRERLDGQRRAAGDRVERGLVLFVGDGFAPVWGGRVPYPFRAAMVFVDHADQSREAQLQALAGGFAGRRLPFTKTLFLRSDRGPQLDAPAFRALARRLVSLGVEVAPHSITDRTDGRDRVHRGLAVFQELGAATWVDHSPITNCEAISNSGTVRGGRYFLIDLLKAAGVRYAWSGLDLRSSDLNLLAPDRPAERRYLFYAHERVDGASDPIWVFPSQWAFRSRREMIRRYGDGALEALVRERGIHIAHTYLDFYHPRTRLRDRTLLNRQRGGFALAPEFDVRLAALARLRDMGRLWVTTIRDLGDHLRRARRVRVFHAADGSVRLENPGSERVIGYQLLAPRDARVSVEGAPFRIDGQEDAVAVGVDLAPGAVATVRLSRPRSP